MTKYICANCNYRFCSENLRQNMCPYCGKKGVVEPEKSASDLLGEADSIE
jgi:DNA-directed RNA polymerase subunit RPC12/RpoP